MEADAAVGPRLVSTCPTNLAIGILKSPGASGEGDHGEIRKNRHAAGAGLKCASLNWRRPWAVFPHPTLCITLTYLIE